MKTENKSIIIQKVLEIVQQQRLISKKKIQISKPELQMNLVSLH
jgi:hypothetical protein